jgi:branched-chain amino acid transport system substrate-binding protein
VPMISPSSTNPAVTQLPYIFRVCFIDQFQGYAEAKFAHDNLKLTRAAIFQEVTSDYSTGLAKYFQQAFTKLGGTIVDKESYSHGDADFKAALTKIKAANPQILVVPGYYGDIGPIAKQARQVGLTVPLIGGDGWDSSKLIEGAGGPGGALEGSYFSDHYSVDSPDPAVQSFVAAYKAAYQGAVPDALAALAYDAAGILADSLKRAGAPADGNYASEAYRAKLRDAIAATKDYKGVTGTITIGPDRNAIKPAAILQIKGDKFAFVTSINPPS